MRDVLWLIGDYAGPNRCCLPGSGGQARQVPVLRQWGSNPRKGQGAFAGLPFPTSDTLQVLGCVDSRVDPGDVLGLELGEGVVMRNIGGRITRRRCAHGHCWAGLARASPRAGTW